MIETKESLEKLDEIMSTPGLDGVYIGPADLSLAIGEEPGFDRAENTKAYSEILKILEQAKKIIFLLEFIMVNQSMHKK
jgi:4-hydroxy-2-oxoheptanedioate aldolase